MTVGLLFIASMVSQDPAPVSFDPTKRQEQDAPEIIIEGKSDLPKIRAQEFGHAELYKGYPAYDTELKWVPLPVLSFSNNEGFSFGASVTFVTESSFGSAETTYTPAIFWNEETELNAYFRTFTNSGAYNHWHVAAQIATERNRMLDVGYLNLTGDVLGFLDGADLRLTHQVEGRSYFYGFGNAASEDTQGNYSHASWDLQAYGFWQIAERATLKTQKIMVYAGPHYNDVMIHTGIVDDDGDIDKIDTYFPGLIGRADGSGYIGTRLGFRYDTRDFEFVPRAGSYVDLFFDANHRTQGSGPRFYPRYGADLRHYWGIDEDIVLLTRGSVEGVSHDTSLPFFLQPMLGGLEDLRAFDLGRYRDFTSAVVNLDLRFRVATFDLFGVPVEFEVGPILDIGTVFGGPGGDTDHVNLNPGIQMRLLNRPNLSMGIVASAGRDGPTVAFGVGLPF